jgi:hypothetical protein
VRSGGTSSVADDLSVSFAFHSTEAVMKCLIKTIISGM